MKINKVMLSNFRIYKGENIVSFLPFSEKNINIIAGKNGYGKTTFLTALIWSFYGRMMSEVEDKYRRDIKNYGGYDKYLYSILNKELLHVENSSFSVEVEITDLMIPSIPCKSVTIKRSYDADLNKEDLQVLIDGDENQLTKEVGYDVFINDFVLPREIAKFFFFDAEKIVSLAEAKTTEELRGLSKAYSEVLGIKKYEDLKKNLESLLTKLKRKGVSGSEKEKLDALLEKHLEKEELINSFHDDLARYDQEIQAKQIVYDALQEKLIREGNAITLDQLNELKNKREEHITESKNIKAKLNEIMELAPLAIAGNKLDELKRQLDIEKKWVGEHTDPKKRRKELYDFCKTVMLKLDQKDILQEDKKKIIEVLQETTKEWQSKTEKVDDSKILLRYTPEQQANFDAVYANIKGSFMNQLSAISQEDKNNRVLLSRVTREIKQAEARSDKAIVKKHQQEKETVYHEIETIRHKKEETLVKLGKLQSENDAIKAKCAEYTKNFKLAETDQKKYETTEKILTKINDLITRIKMEKKFALQNSLKIGLDRLMHKDNFIESVRVNIQDDLMDIDLIDPLGNVINKDTLSKGEQQLYATALLKALVDESGIQFPVFIDSPLQKFDKTHSKNIIEVFYPQISDQVVLLPLLEKELSSSEFELLRPNLNKMFLIENNKGNSEVLEIRADEVFNQIVTHV